MNQSEARLHSGRIVHFRPSLSPRPSFRFSGGLVPRLVWAFHENLTRGEKVEEYERDWCVRGYHVYHEIWEQLLEQLHCNNRLTCQFRPEQSRLYCPYGPRFPLDAVRMASSTSRLAAAIA